MESLFRRRHPQADARWRIPWGPASRTRGQPPGLRASLSGSTSPPRDRRALAPRRRDSQRAHLFPGPCSSSSPSPQLEQESGRSRCHGAFQTSLEAGARARAAQTNNAWPTKECIRAPRARPRLCSPPRGTWDAGSAGEAVVSLPGPTFLSADGKRDAMRSHGDPHCRWPGPRQRPQCRADPGSPSFARGSADLGGRRGSLGGKTGKRVG